MHLASDTPPDMRTRKPIEMLALVLCVALFSGATGQMLAVNNPLKDIAERGSSLKKLDDCFCEVARGDVAGDEY